MTKTLSNFSKGIKDSAALSFALSGQDNCDPSCKLYDNGCYAENIEGIYKSYSIKLKKHSKIPPGNLVYAAIAELKNKRTPVKWFRISVSGSLPARKDLSNKDFKHLKAALEDLAKYLNSVGAKLHVPVETAGKARTYRKILEPFGMTVRRTAQTSSYKDAEDQCAYVAGKDEDWRQIVCDERAKKKKAFVCPAVISKGDNAKCGSCDLCSRSDVDLIIYPFHR